MPPSTPPFEQLDFIYMPSRDVAADLTWFEGVLGGRVVFAIEDGGTRVAMVELTEGPPRLLLTDHVEGDAPILVFRVPDIAAAQRELRARGWEPGRALEIPHGPVNSFRGTGGQRIAIYELKRPFMDEHFAGRRDY